MKKRRDGQAPVKFETDSPEKKKQTTKLGFGSKLPRFEKTNEEKLMESQKEVESLKSIIETLQQEVD